MTVTDPEGHFSCLKSLLIQYHAASSCWAVKYSIINSDTAIA